MITRAEFARIATDVRLDPQVVERDYCQGWLLHGMMRTSLRDGLVFKGGTALRKCYFEDYRFSTDLDFTCLRDALAPDEIRMALAEACATATQQSGVPFTPTDWEQTLEPPRGEAYQAKVSFRGPFAPSSDPPKIALDLTYYEVLVLKPQRRALLHPFSDAHDMASEALVYPIEEIIAEKLRTLLPQRAPERERLPGPRDYYDLWQLLTVRRVSVDRPAVSRTFGAKCEYKGVVFGAPGDFFQTEMLDRCRGAWEATIKRQAHPVPEFDRVIAQLRSAVDGLLANGG